MAISTQPGDFAAPHGQAKVHLGSSTVEGIGGLAAIVLAIFGLIGFGPSFMAAIAVIAIGVALVLEGRALSASYARLLRTTGETAGDRAQIGGGMSAELLGGATGIVLGILALLRIQPDILVACAVIVFGATMMLSAGARSRLDMLSAGPADRPDFQHAANEAMRLASGAEMLVGLSSAVLGVLALVGFQPLVLTLAALLAVGCSMFISGSSASAKMAGLSHAS